LFKEALPLEKEKVLVPKKIHHRANTPVKRTLHMHKHHENKETSGKDMV